MANDRETDGVGSDARVTAGGRQPPAATDSSPEPTLTLRQTLVGIGVVYASLTVFSSTLALMTGSTTETHVHLLLRFGVTTIGVGAFYAYGVLRSRLAGLPSAVTALIAYGLGLAATMAAVWLYGRVDVLHPDAYRDIFLNFTAVAIVLGAVWAAGTRLLRRLRSAAATAAPSSS